MRMVLKVPKEAVIKQEAKEKRQRGNGRKNRRSATWKTLRMLWSESWEHPVYSPDCCWFLLALSTHSTPRPLLCGNIHGMENSPCFHSGAFSQQHCWRWHGLFILATSMSIGRASVYSSFWLLEPVCLVHSGHGALLRDLSKKRQNEQPSHSLINRSVPKFSL